MYGCLAWYHCLHYQRHCWSNCSTMASLPWFSIDVATITWNLWQWGSFCLLCWPSTSWSWCARPWMPGCANKFAATKLPHPAAYFGWHRGLSCRRSSTHYICQAAYLDASHCQSFVNLSIAWAWGTVSRRPHAMPSMGKSHLGWSRSWCAGSLRPWWLHHCDHRWRAPHQWTHLRRCGGSRFDVALSTKKAQSYCLSKWTQHFRFCGSLLEQFCPATATTDAYETFCQWWLEQRAIQSLFAPCCSWNGRRRTCGICGYLALARTQATIMLDSSSRETHRGPHCLERSHCHSLARSVWLQPTVWSSLGSSNSCTKLFFHYHWSHHPWTECEWSVGFYCYYDTPISSPRAIHRSSCPFKNSSVLRTLRLSTFFLCILLWNILGLNFHL